MNRHTDGKRGILGTRSPASGRLGVATLIALVAVAISGCASATGGDTPFSDEASSIRLHVINLNWADARVYALRSTQRISLGRVPGKSEETFTLDWNFSLPLRVEFDLLAGGRCTTRELSVDPGDFIELQISGNDLRGICG